MDLRHHDTRLPEPSPPPARFSEEALDGCEEKAQEGREKVGKAIGKKALKAMLKRLAKVAKKLLNQVLQAGGKHLPTRYRPLFDMLRKRLIKKEHADDEALGEWLSGGMAPLQNELDFHLASALLEGEHSTSGVDEELDYSAMDLSAHLN